MPGAVSVLKQRHMGDTVAVLPPVRDPHESNGGRGFAWPRGMVWEGTEDTVSPWLSPTACLAR